MHVRPAEIFAALRLMAKDCRARTRLKARRAEINRIDLALGTLRGHIPCAWEGV